MFADSVPKIMTSVDSVLSAFTVMLPVAPVNAIFAVVPLQPVVFVNGMDSPHRLVTFQVPTGSPPQAVKAEQELPPLLLSPLQAIGGSKRAIDSAEGHDALIDQTLQRGPRHGLARDVKLDRHAAPSVH
jgi:hypothetical protein